MESYGGLPAQLVHLQNPFLHPALEARLPFGSSGAFRPVVTSSTSSTPTSTSSADDRLTVKGLSSAFTAANLVNNRRKLDTLADNIDQQHHGGGRSRGSGGSSAPSQSQQNDGGYSQQGSANGAGVINLDKSTSSGSSSSSGFMNGGQSRHRTSSPSSVHLPNNSPSVKQEERDRGDDCGGDERDGNGTPNSDVTERSTPEDTHPSKSKKKLLVHSSPIHSSIKPAICGLRHSTSAFNTTNVTKQSLLTRFIPLINCEGCDLHFLITRNTTLLHLLID